jgi:hypothetical protein
MEQYAQSDAEQTVSHPNTSHMLNLKAQVMPHVVELKWENQMLRLPNPEYVEKLHRMCEQLHTELTQIRTQHVQLQQQHAQLVRVVQQLQNQLQG